MRGHTDTVTGMELSPDGSYLLSNAMDNSGTCCYSTEMFNSWQIFKKCGSPMYSFFSYVSSPKMK